MCSHSTTSTSPPVAKHRRTSTTTAPINWLGRRTDCLVILGIVPCSIKDELISQKFPPDSGFEVTYRFTIEGDVPKPLYIVIERPDLYSITCNGKPVTAPKDSWWLDKAFGKIDITAQAKQGENAVTLKAQPFTMYHEIAAAFVLGDFSLRPASVRLRDRAAARRRRSPRDWLTRPTSKASPG